MIFLMPLFLTYMLNSIIFRFVTPLALPALNLAARHLLPMPVGCLFRAIAAKRHAAPATGVASGVVGE